MYDLLSVATIFVFVNVSVPGLGALFGWYHPGNVGMVTFMEGLIIGVYLAVNLIVYISDKIVADRMNRELEEFKNSRN